MAQYCEKCNARVDIPAKYCQECGEVLTETNESAAHADYSRDVQSAARSTSGGIRFNFSKPLSFVLALVMLATFFFPWMSANAVLNGTKLLTNRGVNIFELPSFISGCIDKALKLAGPGSELTQEGEHLVWLLNGMLLLLTGLFFLIALHFVLFGVIGLFSAGKLRYYFARVGGTLYFIALLLFIGLVFIGNSALSSISEKSTAEGVITLNLSVSPTVYVYAAAVLALVFRVLGIRALRRLNAESCLNRCKYDVARREIGLLKSNALMARLPKAYSRGSASKE